MAAFYSEGLYRVQFTKQALGVSSQKGTPQFVLAFNVLGRYDQNGNVHQVQQYERAFYRPITEKTVEYLLQDLDNLGMVGITSFKQLDPSHPNPALITGEGDMWCGSEEGQDGKPRERWSVPRAGGVEVKQLPASEASKLDNMFGAALKKWSAGRGPKPVPVAAAAPAAASDDDEVPY